MNNRLDRNKHALFVVGLFVLAAALWLMPGQAFVSSPNLSGREINSPASPSTAELVRAVSIGALFRHADLPAETTEAQKPAPPANDIASLPTRYSLVGTIQTDSAPIAVLQANKSNEFLYLRIGDQIESAKLIDIDMNSATFSDGISTATIALTLHEGSRP